MAQEPVRVIVEKKPSGCGAALGIMILLGLAIEYWYVSLAIVAVVIGVALMRAARQRELARHKPGPRDPWLNEVAVALAELGFKELARNTGAQLGGAPIEGDIGLRVDRLKVHITLFSDQRRAREAELGLRARPELRDAVSKGATSIKTVDRVVYVAHATSGVVDEFRVDELVRVVRRLAVPPRLAVTGAGSSGHHFQGLPSSPPAPASPDLDVLEQLRTLGDLRSAGVLTEAEFEAKKTELLGRI
jgi:Short C-terminal domain